MGKKIRFFNTNYQLDYWLLLITPIIDTINGLYIQKYGATGLSIGTIYRLLFMLYVIARICKKKMLFIRFLPLLYFPVIGIIRGASGGGLFGCITYAMKWLLPLILIIYYGLAKNNKQDIKRCLIRCLEFWSAFVPLSLIVEYLLQVGEVSYYDAGFKGLYYSTKDIILIGNGVSKLDFEPMTNQERENIFLTVARLGTVQKATDILLEAFAKSADKHNWDLKLIGTVEKEFRPYIEEYYKKYPELKSRVHFVGQIKNRELLYNEYCRAKVFVLPSRWESYGISCAEALSCGCRLILTDTIPPAKELTNNERYGKIIEANNVDALSEAIIGAVNQEYTQLDIDERVQYANAKFSWEKICATLYDAMEKVDSKKGNEQER